MADRDLANYDAELAGKVEVLPGLDVHLAFIDTAAAEDKYYKLQGLKDPTAAGDPNCHYLFQRWGGTGTRGQMQVDGPMLQSTVAVALSKIFKEKTGAEWGSLKPGDRVPAGKYWLQQQSTPDLAAKWEYYVGDGVDGKRPGWYPYDNYAGDEAEELYAQHVANCGESRTAERVLSSGHFRYTVDLVNMTQRNMKTNKVRTIRRSSGEQSSAAPTRKAMKRARSPAPAAMKSMKGMAPPKSVMRAMKAMKATTKKKVSKTGTKSQVLKGLKVKTKGGMRASDLMKNKNGKVVSKKKHFQGRNAYDKHLAKWVDACSKARKELNLKGFVAVKKGSDFYNRVKSLMSVDV